MSMELKRGFDCMSGSRIDDFEQLRNAFDEECEKFASVLRQNSFEMKGVKWIGWEGTADYIKGNNLRIIITYEAWQPISVFIWVNGKEMQSLPLIRQSIPGFLDPIAVASTVRELRRQMSAYRKAFRTEVFQRILCDR